MTQPKFPGESAEYRNARDDLLRKEVELRRQIESVAAARRKLPIGGRVEQDYVFEEGATDLLADDNPRATRFSELFGEGKDTLLL